MRIGFLSDTIFPAVGGQGRTAERLVLGLSHRGHHVTAYTARTGGGGQRAPEGVVLRTFPAMHARALRLPARWALATPAVLHRAFARDALEVLHVSTLYSPFSLAALRACRQLALPLIAHIQTQPEHLLAHVHLADSPPAVGLLYRGLTTLWSRADVVVAVSHRAGTLLRDQGLARDPLVIPNGVDSAFWSPGTPDADFVAREQLVGRRVVLSVSRLMKDKNLSLLLAAFGEVRRTFPDALLVFVGEGPERPRLAAEAEAQGFASAVRFPGWVSREADLRQWYRASTVFVLSSRVEIQSLVLLEAMACGKPVIVAEAPANLATDLVVDGKSGFRVSPTDPRELAARLHDLLGDAELSARLGAAGRAHVAQSHSLPVILAQWERVYASVARP